MGEDEKLFSDELLDELKGKYGKVFKSEFNVGAFAWRVLGRKEYKIITEDDTLTVFQREEDICKTCVLFPETYDFENGAAGIATLLSEQIMDASGFLALSKPQEM
jgi:hypothetical protein